MKGQLVFEFLVAAILFFAIVVYTLSALGSSIAGASERSQADVTQARALEVSELLMTQKGVWVAGVPQQLGLAAAAGYPVLDAQKLQDLETNCAQILGPLLSPALLGTDDKPLRTYQYRIEIRDPAAQPPTLLYGCGAQPLELTQGTATRLGLLFNPANPDPLQPVSLHVTVW